jgi:uncharacterized membrane protein affecting hemolysin expression
MDERPLTTTTHKVEDPMHDTIESLVICFSVGIIFTPLILFLLFLRYINHKEKAALAELNEE